MTFQKPAFLNHPDNILTHYILCQTRPGSQIFQIAVCLVLQKCYIFMKMSHTLDPFATISHTDNCDHNKHCCPDRKHTTRDRCCRCRCHGNDYNSGSQHYAKNDRQNDTKDQCHHSGHIQPPFFDKQTFCRNRFLCLLSVVYPRISHTLYDILHIFASLIDRIGNIFIQFPEVL